MPELPEVETYRRDLAAVLPGRVVLGAHTDWPNQLPLNDPRALSSEVAGLAFGEVARHGKILRIGLGPKVLLVHLKMSGRLRLVDAAAAPDPHAHVVFDLDRDQELRFVDPRKFGRVWVVSDSDVVLGGLGPDALADTFSCADFARRIAVRRGRLKPLLLNQSFVAGLGNIYVDETLWEARLHPLATADGLTGAHVRGLYEAFRRVLAAAVAARGTTLSAGGYRDLKGSRGNMARELAVFRRTGRPCLRCGTPIQRIVVQARGTHFCPRCQKV